MKNAPANNSSGENYVVEIDGIPKFEYRVFVQALSAALRLRQDLPDCHVQLRTAEEGAFARRH